jgi:hypothetical protein
MSGNGISISAANLNAAADERRNHRRFAMSMTVAITLPGGGQVVGRLRDLSLGGLFAELGREIDVRRVVTLNFMLENNQFCMARGTVVRNEAARGFGVEFLDLSEQLRTFLLDLHRMREPMRSEFLQTVLDPQIVIR